jgi:UDP-glucose 4-epimerase
VPVVMGFDPSIQLIHVEDLSTAIEVLMAPDLRGPFNIAGPPPVSLRTIIKTLNRTTIALPRALLASLLRPAWNLGITRFRPEELDLIQFSCIVSDARLRAETPYQPAYGLRQTLLSVDAPF